MARVLLERIGKLWPDGTRAVEAFDLEIADGELIVLVGPSGCGKSTTLRMIAGLEEATEGRVRIGERDVTGVPAKDRDVAMVFQSYALYPHLTVRRNLAFPLERRRAHRGLRRLASGAAARKEDLAIAARVDTAARTLGITELLRRKPGELSGGQRQRVAVGRAIVRDPAVFLFDEPLSNLDAKLRLEMRTELKALHRKLEATMVYVTHDQEEAMTLGDRLVVMKDGVVQQVGPPSEVYGRPANRFVAGFVGTPPMNFLDATVADRGAALELCGELLSVPEDRRAALLEHSAVVLGLRPDRCAPGADGLAATVALVEDLGDRRDVVYRLGSGQTLVGRVPPAPELVEGREVRLPVDLHAVHVFAATGAGERIA